MKSKAIVFVALLLLALSLPIIGLSQDQVAEPQKDEAPKTADKKIISTVSVKVKVSAEGKAAIPAGSKIRWEGIEESCKSFTGELNIRSMEATPLSLPVCRVKLTVFITGFDTKAVTIDLADSEEKRGNPIRIKVKRQGPAEVDWK